jgi:hypothetical protein
MSETCANCGETAPLHRCDEGCTCSWRRGLVVHDITCPRSVFRRRPAPAPVPPVAEGKG